MHFSAKNASKPTLLSLTNHAYWNLDGHDKCTSVANHQLHLPSCSQYTETDDELTITGNLISVQGTKYDFRGGFRALGDDPSYDLNYAIDGAGVRLAAVVKSSDESVKMRVLTDAPGVQVYSCCGFDPAHPQCKVEGKNGARFTRYGAICLETQNFPDAVNNSEAFGHNSILRPGETYSHTAIYDFK